MFIGLVGTGHYIKGPGYIYLQKQTHPSVKAVLVASMKSECSILANLCQQVSAGEQDASKV